MGNEAAVPPSFWDKVQKIADDAVLKFARSGFLRNASITGGAGLTIADGGALKAQTVDGQSVFYVGGGLPLLGDGTNQPLVILRRADGSNALAIYDPAPASGGFQQFLAIYDRNQNIIVSDDTNSGQGLARPYLGGGFARTRYSDWSVSTTSATFETLWDTKITKQQPQLEVRARASMDTAATTGELRVLVDGVQLGTTTTEGFSIATRVFGPAAVAGTHMQEVTVEIQGRRTSATGALRVEPVAWRSRQS